MRAISLPVRTVGANVDLTPKQVARNSANGGRTRRAAERLACLRLRRLVLQADCVAVSIPQIREFWNIEQDRVTIVAACRVVDGRRMLTELGVGDVPLLPSDLRVWHLEIPFKPKKGNK